MGAYHSTKYPLKSGVAGDFHRPYEDSEDLALYHSSGDTPSVSLSLDSSLKEGAGNGWCHSSGCSLNRGVTGDFHRPYEDSKDLALYHSSGDTPSVTPVGRDSSLREGAGKRSHSSGYSLKSGVSGDFHRPYGGRLPFLVKKAGGSVEGCCPLEG